MQQSLYILVPNILHTFYSKDIAGSAMKYQEFSQPTKKNTCPFRYTKIETSYYKSLLQGTQVEKNEYYLAFAIR